MSQLSFSPEARQDLRDIVGYIAKDTPASARKLVDLLDETCRQLAKLPGMGSKRDDLLDSLRVFPVKKYVICYRRAAEGGIEVIRVVHGARDFDRLFDV